MKLNSTCPNHPSTLSVFFWKLLNAYRGKISLVCPEVTEMLSRISSSHRDRIFCGILVSFELVLLRSRPTVPARRNQNRRLLRVKQQAYLRSWEAGHPAVPLPFTAAFASWQVGSSQASHQRPQLTLNPSTSALTFPGEGLPDAPRFRITLDRRAT